MGVDRTILEYRHFVFTALAGGGMTAGQVVRVSGFDPVTNRYYLTVASAAVPEDVNDLLFLFLEKADGTAVAVLNDEIHVGLITPHLARLPGAIVDDLVYVDDVGALSLTVGTIERIVAKVISLGVPPDAWVLYDGTESVSAAALGAAFLLDGPVPAGLPSGKDVGDMTAALALTCHDANPATVLEVLSLKRTVDGGVGAAGAGASQSMYAEDDAGAEVEILKLAGEIVNPATGAVESRLRLFVRIGGALFECLQSNANGLSIANAYKGTAPLAPPGTEVLVVDGEVLFTDSLWFNKETATNNDVVELLRLEHRTSDVAHGDGGIGASIAAYAEDDAGVSREIGSIEFLLTQALTADFDGALVFKIANNAAPTEVARFDETGCLRILGAVPPTTEKIAVTGGGYFNGTLIATILKAWASGASTAALELGLGKDAVISGATDVRLRYNETTHKLEFSIEAAAYADLLAAGSHSYSAGKGITGTTVQSAVEQLAAQARVALVDGANVAIDPSLGREFYLVMDEARATRAITIAAGTDGQRVVVWVANDADARTTDVTATWVGVTWVGCYAPNTSNRVSQMDRFEFTYSSADATWYGTVVHQTKERLLPWVNGGGGMTPKMLGCDTVQQITCVDGEACIINAPTECYVGQRISLVFTQGALGTAAITSWNAVYKGAGAALPLKAGSGAVTVYDGIVRAAAAGTATAVSLSGMQE